MDHGLKMIFFFEKNLGLYGYLINCLHTVYINTKVYFNICNQL